MKCLAYVCFLACLASAHGQYFSAGWSPGQTVSPSATPAPEYPPSAKPLGGFLSLLTSSPVSNLFASFGVNISEKLEAAVRKQAEIWDPRIPLVNDTNYDELIVNEKMTPEEEKKRVWFLVVTPSAGKSNPISQLIDEAFDAAYNETALAKDLPNVKWGRIDYMAVTYLTTKWALWQAPYVVVVKDRGQTLRFYKASHLRIKADLIRQFLKEEGWKDTPPWSTMYSPGGSREWWMEYFAVGLAAIYNTIIVIPSFVLLLLTGVFATFLLRWLHVPAQPKPAPRQVAPASAPSDAKPIRAATTKVAREGPKQRKGGKK